MIGGRLVLGRFAAEFGGQQVLDRVVRPAAELLAHGTAGGVFRPRRRRRALGLAFGRRRRRRRRRRGAGVRRRWRRIVRVDRQVFQSLSDYVANRHKSIT